MLRRSWTQVVEALRAKRRMIASANAEVATVGAFEGDVLELVCPPGREFAAKKLEEKQKEVKEALADVFGISPELRFTVRAGTVPEPDPDEPPPTPEAAEELVRRQFGAEVVAPEE